jgi:hypothetical protein
MLAQLENSVPAVYVWQPWPSILASERLGSKGKMVIAIL